MSYRHFDNLYSSQSNRKVSSSKKAKKAKRTPKKAKKAKKNKPKNNVPNPTNETTPNAEESALLKLTSSIDQLNQNFTNFAKQFIASPPTSTISSQGGPSSHVARMHPTVSAKERMKMDKKQGKKVNGLYIVDRPNVQFRVLCPYVSSIQY